MPNAKPIRSAKGATGIDIAIPPTNSLRLSAMDVFMHQAARLPPLYRLGITKIDSYEIAFDKGRVLKRALKPIELVDSAGPTVSIRCDLDLAVERKHAMLTFTLEEVARQPAFKRYT